MSNLSKRLTEVLLYHEMDEMGKPVSPYESYRIPTIALVGMIATSIGTRLVCLVLRRETGWPVQVTQPAVGFAVLSTIVCIGEVVLRGTEAIGKGWICLNVGTCLLWFTLLWQAHQGAVDPTVAASIAAVVLAVCWLCWAHNPVSTRSARRWATYRQTRPGVGRE